jgi:cytochrome-b5 reductase
MLSKCSYRQGTLRWTWRSGIDGVYYTRLESLNSECFLDLKLKSIEPYNHNTSCFTFELPNSGTVLSPITLLVVVHTPEGSSSQHALVDKKGNLAMCAYTPISDPDQKGELVLLIKKYVHERLKPSDTLTIKGPIPKFAYKGTSFVPLASPLLTQTGPSHRPSVIL